MLIRRTSFVALINTADWWNDEDDIFFDAYRNVNNGRTSGPLAGQAGPLNIECRIWTTTNNARDNITLTWQKWDGGAWVTAPGSVAEGLPGGAAGTYSASSPVYSDPNHRWIIGTTGRYGDLAHYYAVCYLQFRNFKTEDLGVYRAVCAIDYGSGDVTAYLTAYFGVGLIKGGLELKD